jgi:hypothetical protein
MQEKHLGEAEAVAAVAAVSRQRNGRLRTQRAGVQEDRRRDLRCGSSGRREKRSLPSSFIMDGRRRLWPVACGLWPVPVVGARPGRNCRLQGGKRKFGTRKQLKNLTVQTQSLQ